MEKVSEKLSLLDKLLPLWIFLAMGLGVLLGIVFPSIGPALDTVKIADVSLPIAIGLLWMMYPVLAKVKYEKIGQLGGTGKTFILPIFLNWIVGPLLMFFLAWFLLPDFPEYRTGLILVGIAPCIAMVLVWNMLAKGSTELGAILVAINSILQILLFSVYGYFLLMILPNLLGGSGTSVVISMWEIAKSVLIFLGIPLVAGYLTRTILIRKKGQDWYENKFMPRLGPTALIGLLYTIVLMFSMQGEKIVALPMHVVRIAIPLLLYFAIMWTVGFFASKAMKLGYTESATIAFTSAGNNFELAIAVAVGIFGISSGQALSAVVGPLIEVPALIGLVYVSLWLKNKYFPSQAK